MRNKVNNCDESFKLLIGGFTFLRTTLVFLNEYNLWPKTRNIAEIEAMHTMVKQILEQQETWKEMVLRQEKQQKEQKKM